MGGSGTRQRRNVLLYLGMSLPPLGEVDKLCYRERVTRASLEKLRSLEVTFDLFDRGTRSWEHLLPAGLYPPLPVAGGELIWGFALMKEAAALGLVELNCVELKSGDPVALLLHALRLENRSGAYSLPEQSRLYAFLEKNRIRESAPAILPLVTDQKPAGWLAAMGGYAAFSPELRLLLDENLLDLKTAARVQALPAAVFQELYRAGAGLTFSERRLFVTRWWEISRREGLTSEATEALARESLSLPQAAAAGSFAARLEARRFPELTRLKERMADITAGLAREGVTVAPPPDFEGEEYGFAFHAASRAVYGRKLAALKAFEDEIDRLFELL